jgi:hypothetical protein
MSEIDFLKLGVAIVRWLRLNDVLPTRQRSIVINPETRLPALDFLPLSHLSS